MRHLNSLIGALMLWVVSTLAVAAVTLTDLDGKKIPFESLKGKWVFINYWASWCNPCVEEIKQLNTFYDKNKTKLALYAVNYDAIPVAHQKQLVQELGLHYPSLAKDPGPQLALGNVQGVPATFVFDPKGRLVDTLYGGQTVRTLTAVFKEHGVGLGK